MKLMVIGGGGREHAIIKKLKENPAVEKIYCLPGNGGIAADAVCVSEIGAKDIPAQVEFAKAHGIDYAVVAPDDPLALGAVDALSAAGIPCFGPDKKAAVIEASKAFAKDLMQKYNIPTAKYRVFTDAPSACAYIDAEGAPIVVKADGLALGMGAVAPNAYYTKEIAAECMENIFLPTIRAMRAEGRPFRGCLYFGLMLTKSGPKVVEYNCRFGDPETQAVLPLLKSDLLTVMQATTNGTLADVSVEFSTDSACCVVLASEGYPQKYESGFPITMSEEAAAHCYVAGAKKDSDTLLTAGGRVLGVTAVAPTLRAAVEDAYHLAEGVDFANKYCRGDIGSAALAAREERG